MSQAPSKAPTPPPVPPKPASQNALPPAFTIEGRCGKVDARSGKSAKTGKDWHIRFAQIQTWGETFEVGFEDGPAGDDLFRRLTPGTIGVFYGTLANKQGIVRMTLTHFDA